MTRETYRGVKLSARNLRGKYYGKVRLTVGGQAFGDWVKLHSEAESIESLRRTVDAAYDRPEAYPDYWRAP
ncbi:MAG: hypothetical protein H0U59_05765 [Gemmatimonadaceae bacterium]|nr:hypothetical protein [Gemmatimonadaceae bacterium]